MSKEYCEFERILRVERFSKGMFLQFHHYLPETIHLESGNIFTGQFFPRFNFMTICPAQNPTKISLCILRVLHHYHIVSENLDLGKMQNKKTGNTQTCRGFLFYKRHHKDALRLDLLEPSFWNIIRSSEQYSCNTSRGLKRLFDIAIPGVHCPNHFTQIKPNHPN